MTPLKSKLVKIISFAFVIIFFTSFFLREYLRKIGFDFNFLIIGNCFLYFIFITSIFVHSANAYSSNANAFLRSVYLAMIIKMFGSAIAIIIFVVLNNGKINNPSLLTLMLFYIIYTSIEVTVLMKSIRKRNA